MPNYGAVDELKALLRREVHLFCRHDSRIWKQPIVDTIDELRRQGWYSVFFGGTLRSLLLSRLTHRTPGRPRDVDIVVHGVELATLRREFESHVQRETRFGGLQLRRCEWQFDVWPLERTWAFVEESIDEPEFAHLPSTTFFNLEAIAVDVWPRPGHARRIYSGDDQFFRGVMSRVLDVNREENPFPELCVVRALILASELRFRLSRRLASYVVAHGSRLTECVLDDVQQKHFGRLRQRSDMLRRWIDHLGDRVSQASDEPVELQLAEQRMLWPEEEKAESAFPHIQIRQLG